MLRVDIQRRYEDFFLKTAWEVDKGEVIGIFGPSGSGKSLSIRSIAGLETPDSGLIEIDGRFMFHHQFGICLPARDRQVGYVPQNYGLFPHMSVARNIEFAMREKDSRINRQKALSLLDRVGLVHKQSKYPGQISGGEKQRVALLRALANNPRVLLLDEPFSAVDIPIRKMLRNEIREFLRQWQIPIVLVSHDPEDMAVLATKVVQYG